MSSLKVFISSFVLWQSTPGTSSVVASPSCLVERLLAIFCAVFTGFFAFSLSQAKEVFYASPRTCSSAQSKEEPPAHFEKRVCLFVFGSLKGDNGFENILKWHRRKTFFCSCCVTIWRQLLRRCETISLSLVFNSQFHAKYLASLTNQNARFYSVMRFYCKLMDVA